MQGWWEQDGSRLVEGSFDKIGYNDPANKKSAIVKAMMEISKRRPDLFFNNLPSLEQFGYKRFGEKVTDRINKWLDDDPKIDIGDNVPGTPWTQAGENAFGIGDITEAFDSPSLSNAVGALASFYTGGLSSTPSAVKDLAFSLGLPGASKTIDKKWDDNDPSPIAPFKAKEIDYSSPLPETNNLNDIRLDGPIYTVNFTGPSNSVLGALTGFSRSIAEYLGSIENSLPEQAYYRFIQRVMSDIASAKTDESFLVQVRGTNESGEQDPTTKSWEELFNQLIEESVEEEEPSGRAIGNELARLILIALRIDTWDNLADKLKDISPDGEVDTNKLLSDSFEEAEKDFNKNNQGLVGEEEVETLTEAQIKDRQKFKKQCALMTQMKEMKEINRSLIRSKYGIHSDSPYDNRFHMLTALDKTTIPNKLVTPKAKNIKPFLEITPDIHAFLVPKIRLFKVFNKEGGELDEIEFVFSNFVNPKRVNTLQNTFDKGDGAGIKNFSFTFEGTNPATARNDISAELSLYFQSFNDFIKKRNFKGTEGKHAYVDLLLLPAGKAKSGYDTGNPLQDDPSYYRIRADVGWSIDPKGNPEFQKVLKNRGTTYEKLKKALQVINKSFYLNMVDHDLQIRDDGTVEIKAIYRAYIETALKGTGMDALASPSIKKERFRLNQEYQKVIDKNVCTPEQLNEIKSIITQRMEVLRKESYQSIMARMVANGSVFYVNANKDDLKHYSDNGFFRKKVEFLFTNQGLSDQNIRDEAEIQPITQTSEDTAFTLDTSFKDLDTSPDDDWTTINFFFLGDLIYTILDCNYTNAQGNSGIQIPNLKFLLSSFDYDNLFDKDASKQFANIADIPVSCEYFFEWYTENVVKKESPAYPVMFFIRDLVKHLIVNVLSDNCFKVAMNKNLSFKTGNFISTQGNVFDQVQKNLQNNDYNVDQLYDKGYLPMESVDSSGEVSIRNFYNYIFIYALMPPLSHRGRGIKRDDGDRGIYHYQLGSINGIMKKVNFSKTDIQYLREARFFRNGNDGLMQLGNVYRVSMEMIGNTIYYPGMEFYIDPKGIGSGDDFDPTIGPSDGREASIANALGLGGYHLVTRVKSQISPGKFTTSVEGQFIYSGDGNPRKLIDGEKENSINNVDTKIEKRSQACEPFVNGFYTEALGGKKVNVDEIAKNTKDSGKTNQTQINQTQISQAQINQTPLEQEIQAEERAASLASPEELAAQNEIELQDIERLERQLRGGLDG